MIGGGGRATRATALALALTAGAANAAAQRPLSAYAEWRGDAIAATGATAHLAAGVEIPFGNYVREGVLIGGGATRLDGATRASGRVDLLTRFLLDPWREVPWGLSLGGGLTVPVNERPGPTRPFIAVVADLEGPRTGRISPAVQLGLGGGARIGLVLRTNRPDER